jgi:hypothetical protein
MVEAPENGKESSHSPHANGMNEMEIQISARCHETVTKINAESTKVYQWSVTFCTVYISTQVKN